VYYVVVLLLLLLSQLSTSKKSLVQDQQPLPPGWVSSRFLRRAHLPYRHHQRRAACAKNPPRRSRAGSKDR
jgi:hypothetical protein